MCSQSLLLLIIYHSSALEYRVFNNCSYSQTWGWSLCCFPLPCSLCWRVTVLLALVWPLSGYFFQGTEQCSQPLAPFSSQCMSNSGFFLFAWTHMEALGSLLFSAEDASKPWRFFQLNWNPAQYFSWILFGLFFYLLIFRTMPPAVLRCSKILRH